jgi:hypothetical protein
MKFTQIIYLYFYNIYISISISYPYLSLIYPGTIFSSFSSVLYRVAIQCLGLRNSQPQLPDSLHTWPGDNVERTPWSLWNPQAENIAAMAAIDSPVLMNLMANQYITISETPDVLSGYDVHSLPWKDPPCY